MTMGFFGFPDANKKLVSGFRERESLLTERRVLWEEEAHINCETGSWTSISGSWQNPRPLDLGVCVPHNAKQTWLRFPGKTQIHYQTRV